MRDLESRGSDSLDRANGKCFGVIRRHTGDHRVDDRLGEDLECRNLLLDGVLESRSGGVLLEEGARDEGTYAGGNRTRDGLVTPRKRFGVELNERKEND